jgi:hypothetical protein
VSLLGAGVFADRSAFFVIGRSKPRKAACQGGPIAFGRDCARFDCFGEYQSAGGKAEEGLGLLTDYWVRICGRTLPEFGLEPLYLTYIGWPRTAQAWSLEIRKSYED